MSIEFKSLKEVFDFMIKENLCTLHIKVSPIKAYFEVQYAHIKD